MDIKLIRLVCEIGLLGLEDEFYALLAARFIRKVKRASLTPRNTARLIREAQKILSYV